MSDKCKKNTDVKTLTFDLGPRLMVSLHAPRSRNSSMASVDREDLVMSRRPAVCMVLNLSEMSSLSV